MASARATAANKKTRGKKTQRVRFSQLRSMRREVRASYDAASDSDSNLRHWSNADALSAADSNAMAVRVKLRMRARYEYFNNSYCHGIGQTLSHYVIGRGPRLNFRTGNPESDRAVESAFAQWAKAVRLPEKLRTYRLSLFHTGEGFMQFITNERHGNPVTLDLALVESDRISSPWSGRERDGEIEGITYDENGNPTSYRIVSDDGTAGSTSVPASKMIHWFRQDRPGQLRGVPEITPALNLFAMLRRYTLATVQAAETAANHAMTIETDQAADSEIAPEAMDTIELERGMATFLPATWKMSQTKPEQPATTYPSFHDKLLNEIARCVSMPFNIATCNSSGYNYASGNLDHLTFWRTLVGERQVIEDIVLDRILAEWLSEATRIPGLIPPVAPGREKYVWFWDPREHADPTKEASARDTNLKNGSTSFEVEWTRLGMDPEEQFAQLSTEYNKFKSAGIPHPLDALSKPAPSADVDNADPGDGDGNDNRQSN